jgi:hypothetical protein
VSSPVPRRLSPGLGAALAATAAFAALWLALPDKTFVFDGVMFAGFVERGVEEWRAELYNPRHLLYAPFFQLVRDLLAKGGLAVEAYRLFQVFNALLGALGLWVFGDLLRRITKDAALSAVMSLVLAATWTYGTRATEGQVYMFLAVGCLSTLWACVRCLEEPSTENAVLIAVLFAVSSLFHAASAFLFPAVLLCLWFSFRGSRRGYAAAAVSVAVAVSLLTVPYALSFWSVGLKPFLSKATDFHGTEGGGFFSGLVARFWSSGGFTPLGRLMHCWRESGLAWAPLPEGAAAAWGLALWATGFGALSGAWKALSPLRRAAALTLAAAWLGFLVVNAFWLGGLFFQPVPTACMLALLAAAGAPRLETLEPRQRRGLLGGLAFVGLCLAASNVKHGLLPQSKLENNPGVRAALWLRDHTVPSSWILISGLGGHNAKIYIPKFAGRSREVLEYYFDRHPREQALRLLAGFVDLQTRGGVPLYLLSDLVEDQAVPAEMSRRWGVSLADVQHAFGSGRVVLLAKGPDTAAYLFVPAARQPELFAGLSYSALTESDQKRLDETAAGLKEIARGMTPEERVRAARLLRTGNWGFDGVQAGFAPFMGAESAARVGERRARYEAHQKTADFWLRAGNLLRILGRKDEAVDAWTRAQRISGDQALLSEIEALKKAR